MLHDDWEVSGADFEDKSEGTVFCNSTEIYSDKCRYNFTTSTVKTDVGNLRLDYAGSSVRDLSDNAAASPLHL